MTQSSITISKYSKEKNIQFKSINNNSKLSNIKQSFIINQVKTLPHRSLIIILILSY